MSLISFIIPAYNAADFIAEAIRSVRAQSYPDWELIIIDDLSSDDTLSIAQSFAISDSRIRILKRKDGSGSAFIPRHDGIKAARGEYILPLDADDVILPDYASNLLAELKKQPTAHDSTIVYPAEYLWTPPFNPSMAQKPEYFDQRKEIVFRPGSDAVAYTLDGWRVPAAGGLIPRSLYLKAYNEYGVNPERFIHADEILTRHLMYLASAVIFTDSAIYYCRQNEESITRRPSLRRLDILTAGETLIDFTRQRFGKASEEYLRAHRQLFHSLFDCLDWLSHPSFTNPERKDAYCRIREARRRIDRKLIRPSSSKRLMALFPLPLPLIRLLLKLRRKPQL